MQEFFDFECKFLKNCGNFALKTIQSKQYLTLIRAHALTISAFLAYKLIAAFEQWRSLTKDDMSKRSIT